VGGYRDGRIFNIDDHALTHRMQRQVSSTNLRTGAARIVRLRRSAPGSSSRIAITADVSTTIASAGKPGLVVAEDLVRGAVVEHR